MSDFTKTVTINMALSLLFIALGVFCGTVYSLFALVTMTAYGKKLNSYRDVITCMLLWPIYLGRLLKDIRNHAQN